jgi:hypothetical protein
MTSAATFDEQYQALRHGRGMIEMAGWSSVTVSGADRQKFLNNFCTNDVKSLAPGKSCETFITNVKGRVIGHGFVSCRDHELVFLGMPGQARRLIEHLDRYILREDVQLRDTTAERVYWLFAKRADAGDGKGDDAECDTEHGTIHIAWNPTGSDMAVLAEFTPDQARSMIAMGVPPGYIEIEAAAFDAARIETGTPLFGVDFGEENFPQEVNRDREAISFTTGCYLGQETVARIDALGHVNQKLVGVRCAGVEVPAAGTTLLKNGVQVGRVTSAAYSPQLGTPLAMAMVRREANAPGTGLQSPLGGCEVITLPVAASNV